MRVAVSGATGFIGRALVNRLLSEGHEVLALLRDPERQARRLPPRAQAAPFVASETPARGLLAGCEAVIHLAGEPVDRRWTDAYKRRLLDSRVQGTRAVVRAAKDAGTVRVFLSASAIGYYGARGAEELDEAAPPGDDFLARICVAWEQAAQEDAGSWRGAVFRMGVVLHPEGGALSRMLLPFRLGLGGAFGSGEQYMSWIARDDLASLLLFSLTGEAIRGPVNAVSPSPVTNAEFSRTLAKVLHRPEVLKVPAFALRAALGEMSSAVLTGQRVIPRKALEAGFLFAYPKLEVALRHVLSAPSAAAA